MEATMDERYRREAEELVNQLSADTFTPQEAAVWLWDKSGRFIQNFGDACNLPPVIIAVLRERGLKEIANSLQSAYNLWEAQQVY